MWWLKLSEQILRQPVVKLQPEPLPEMDNYYLDFSLETADYWSLVDVGTHAHPMLQYSVVLNGVLEYVVGQHEYAIPEGNGFFVNHNRLHLAASSNSRVEFLSFLVNPEFVTGHAGGATAQKYADPYISSDSSDCLMLYSSDPVSGKVIDAVVGMRDIMRHKNFGYELSVKALAVQAWLNTVVLLRNHDKHNDAPSQSADKVRIDQIITYIHLYYRSKLTLQDIAGSANISQGECCRLFKRMLNTTPIEFLNRYRISQAQLMLCSTNSAILQIAQDTGFPSINHFITMFKRYCGCTPREFRRKFQLSPEKVQREMRLVTHP